MINLSTNQFDGNGHIIKNFASCKPLFALYDAAKLKNLGLINYKRNVLPTNNSFNIGIMSTQMWGGSSIDDCSLINCSIRESANVIRRCSDMIAGCIGGHSTLIIVMFIIHWSEVQKSDEINTVLHSLILVMLLK